MGFNNNSVLNAADYSALSFANDVSPKAKSILFEMVELQQRQQHLQQQFWRNSLKIKDFNILMRRNCRSRFSTEGFELLRSSQVLYTNQWALLTRPCR